MPGPGRPAGLEVVSDVTEESVIDAIEEAAARVPFVIVDLEGTASLMVAYAMSRADLVIIPTQGSQLDAAEAVKAIRLVKSQEKAFKRTIPAIILLRAPARPSGRAPKRASRASSSMQALPFSRRRCWSEKRFARFSRSEACYPTLIPGR